MAQGLVRRILAVQSRGLDTARLLRSACQGDAGLTSELVQHIAQGAGGNVVALARGGDTVLRRDGEHWHGARTQHRAEQCSTDGMAQQACLRGAAKGGVEVYALSHCGFPLESLRADKRCLLS